jgi:ABC-type antimicrobial peptide transport system permease subunit
MMELVSPNMSNVGRTFFFLGQSFVDDLPGEDIVGRLLILLGAFEVGFW